MNRPFRIFFFTIAGILAIYAVLLGCSMHALNLSVLRSNTFWGILAAALFFSIVAWRFPKKAQMGIIAIFFMLFVVEGLLEGAGWLGLLPGVNTDIKASFGRVYTTSEGHGNSIRNRFGWHFPGFDMAAPKRIAVIGDSFVEAVEVGRDANEAAVLQRLLRTNSPDWSVFALGSHGTSPAYHLDVLDYARKHFNPQEAIVILYLGNDLNESLPALNYVPVGSYVYYSLDASNHLALLPTSAVKRERFLRSIERCHQSFWMQLPVIVKSHCMILQSMSSIQESVLRTRQLKKMGESDPEAAKWGRFGMSLKPFITTPDPEAREAMNVMLAELALLKEKCDTNHITLRLVTIPLFPPQFYSTQHGSDWTLQLESYDFLGPDREVKAFAAEHDIPFLSFADWLRAQKTTAEQIHSLYFFNGSGHFTEQGHQLCAQAMFDTFYGNNHK